MKAEDIIQLKPEEEVLEVVHEVMLPNSPRLLLYVLVLALPFFFLFPLWREGLWGVIVFFVLLCIGSLLLYRTFFKWSRTVFIISDRRVVDHEQIGFFTRVVSEARFHQIDEVTYRVKGVIPTLFRYGVVRLQLQGSAADIEFKHVKRPARIADLINDLREEV
ncbi:hypothetical protein CO174_00485 [Candidatus Uhrbacteria bacterium CG_4_9_14_3_um_filter_50_9]|uniref:YdbS-like PH domain-containing protein n=1 Tax=Candidatus Uhrbacteria bacterium CG_4_9_14_3_um_filter_50_9 TaxID=1975035 RepID=A0A2M7XEG5_9BACT|nr:MAG: hypothetical protein CO174_00485 [Candidatus Uhrbacteria bacterium CG_4_9_14_3_um_filter_50_9]